MSLLDFIVLTLAASAIVDVWFNGSIFADWRMFFESKADDTDEPITDTAADPDEDEGDPLPWAMRLADKWVPRPVAELMSCLFCFSHHTPWLVGLLFMLPASAITTTAEDSSHWWLVAAWVLKLPAYSLAATRLGSILNSYLPTEAKYKRV